MRINTIRPYDSGLRSRRLLVRLQPGTLFTRGDHGFLRRDAVFAVILESIGGSNHEHPNSERSFVEMANSRAVIDHAFKGKPLDPSVANRIHERAEKVREDLRKKGVTELDPAKGLRKQRLRNWPASVKRAHLFAISLGNPCGNLLFSARPRS